MSERLRCRACNTELVRGECLFMPCLVDQNPVTDADLLEKALASLRWYVLHYGNAGGGRYTLDEIEQARASR